MNGTSPWEAIQELERKFREGASVHFAQGVIAEDDDALHFIVGQGWYAEALLAGPKVDGQRVKCGVAGDLFSCNANGSFRSRPVNRGDHVGVLLGEGAAAGYGLIVTLAPHKDAPPPDKVCGRGVHAVNLQRHEMIRHAKGEARYEHFEGADCYVKMDGDAGDYTLNMPDGSHLTFMADKIQGGWTYKVKHAKGTCLIVGATGVQMKSPSGDAYLEVTDEGVIVHGKLFKCETGGALICMDPEGDVVGTQGACVSVPNPVPVDGKMITAIRVSRKVHFGV